MKSYNVEYITGDVTNPIDAPEFETKIIAHCCNNLGVMGAGVAAAISGKWPNVRDEYLLWFDLAERWQMPIEGGMVQFIKVEKNIFVANIIGQNGVKAPNNPMPIRYLWIERGMDRVYNFAREMNASVHLPRIGCGLAAGRWDMVEKFCKFVENPPFSFPIFVYDLPENP